MSPHDKSRRVKASDRKVGTGFRINPPPEQKDRAAPLPQSKPRRSAALGASPARSAWEQRREKAGRIIGGAAGFALKLPIHAYRYSLSMLIGRNCRHLPTCSEYAIAAIDLNGPWRGFWLALSRFSRCRPGGTSGFDPAPDIRAERYPLTPWRYGRWRARDIAGDSEG